MQTMTRRPATQKQFDFIKRLVAEKEIPEGLQANIEMHRGNAMRGTMTSQAASGLIDALLTLPKKSEGGETPADLPAGIYARGGTLYRVYLGQQSGKMLVSKVTAEFSGTKCYCSDLQGVSCGVCRGDVERRQVSEVSYEYLGLATKHLPAGAERQSLEQVGEIGIAWNHCLMCGRRLDVPESVDRGIGPVCAAKY